MANASLVGRNRRSVALALNIRAQGHPTSGYHPPEALSLIHSDRLKNFCLLL